MIAITILGFVYGLALGSFAKCIADRSVTNISFFGRSKCPKCRKTLNLVDLIPVVSYIAFRGMCRYCHTRISPTYPLTELITGVLVATLFYLQLPTNVLAEPSITNVLVLVDVVFKSLVLTVFVAIFLTDINTGLIPNRVTYPAIILALIFLFLFTAAKTSIIYISLANSEFGKLLLPPKSDYFLRHALITAEPLTQGVVASFFIGLFFLVLILISRGKGMGGGDLKLGIFMGLTLGIYGSLASLMIAFVSGSIIGIFLLVTRRKSLGQTIPFGPFLSIGSITSLLWGQALTNWYIQLKIPSS